MKKTKKKKGKKVTENKKVDSFFDLFASHVAEEGDKPDSDDEDETAEKMDKSLELANQIKDQCIPLALELYMGVVEFDDISDDDDDDEDVDFDEDEPAAKKGGKPLGGKGANKEAPKGKDGKECKQQWSETILSTRKVPRKRLNKKGEPNKYFYIIKESI